MTKRFDSVLETFVCLVRKSEESDTIGSENRHKILSLKIAAV